MEGSPDQPKTEDDENPENVSTPPSFPDALVKAEAVTRNALNEVSSTSLKGQQFVTEMVKENPDVAAEIVKPPPERKSLLRLPTSVSNQLPEGIFGRRSPFTRNPPSPEERRPRIPYPRTPRDYIINFREDLADFQESHGLPRTRDYSFVSLGLALAQETVRTVYSVFLMLVELFPILAIVSLILRFALDKLIEILETHDSVTKIKKSVIFVLEMTVIIIPLWIFIGTIVVPLVSLIFSIFKRLLRMKGGRKKSQPKPQPKSLPSPPKSDSPKIK